MKRRKLPSQEILKMFFVYNSKTGELRYKKRTPSILKTLKRKKSYQDRQAGRVCKTDTRGYVRATVNTVRTTGHRIIWKLVYNKEPKQIDHINGIKNDNRLCNLRECNHIQNARNSPLKKGNTSGVAGVLHKTIDGNKYWTADGRDGKQRRHLYCGQDFFEAVCARKSFEAKVGVEWYVNCR